MHKCILSEIDFDVADAVEYPFVPFIGLRVRVPGFDMDYCEISSIYWDDEMSVFVVYVEPDEHTRERLGFQKQRLCENLCETITTRHIDRIRAKLLKREQDHKS